MRSAGFDEHVYSDANDFEGLRWVRKREVDVRGLKLEYKGEGGEWDVDQVLGRLVVDENEDMATYYALRSKARDTEVYIDYEYEWSRPTTLVKASELGYLTVVRCLLERGAEVNKAGMNCKTPLCEASYYGQLEVVKALLEAQANVNIADDDGKTPLYYASSKGHLEVVKVLLAAQANVNKADEIGWTPLHRASYQGNLEVVKALLAAQADVNIADYGGRTPLSIARLPVCNCREIAALLREAGAHE